MRVYSKMKKNPIMQSSDEIFMSEDQKVFSLAEGVIGSYDIAGVSGTCMRAFKEMTFERVNIEAEKYIDCGINIANIRMTEKVKAQKEQSFAKMLVGVIEDDRVVLGSAGTDNVLIIKDGEAKKVFSVAEGSVKKIADLNSLKEMAKRNKVESPSSRKPIPVVDLKVEIKSVEIKTGDMLFACCDGVLDIVSKNEVAKLLTENGLEAGCNAVIELIEERCQEEFLDDITIVSYVF